MTKLIIAIDTGVVTDGESFGSEEDVLLEVLDGLRDRIQGGELVRDFHGTDVKAPNGDRVGNILASYPATQRR